MIIELDFQQLVGIVVGGLLLGYLAGCLRAAWYETRRHRRVARPDNPRRPW